MPRKAANGTGCMSYDKTKKLYRYRISVGYDCRGKLKRKVFSGKTQKAALDKYSAWLAANDDEKLYEDITLSEYGQKWLDRYSPKIEESTAEGYKYTLNIIKREIGDMELTEIKARHVEALLDRLVNQYSKSQVGKVRSRLNQILRKAESEGLIGKNPVPLADHTTYKRVEFERSSKASFTTAELKQLMRALPETRIGHSIRLMLGTGIGMGELLALNKDTISPDGSWIKVVQSVKIGKKSKHYIGAVKAENRYREIIVPVVVRPSVRFLFDNANQYIIEGKRKGFPIHPSTYRKYYKKALASVSDVRLLTPHCCRHSYISHLDDANTDFAVIQALSGHSDSESTINYIHPQSESILAAVGKINDILDPENAVGTLLVHQGRKR